MIQMGLYNEFGEKLGSVKFDSNFYCDLVLWGCTIFKCMQPNFFWDYVNRLGLSVGSL